MLNQDSEGLVDGKFPNFKCKDAFSELKMFSRLISW